MLVSYNEGPAVVYIFSNKKNIFRHEKQLSSFEHTSKNTKTPIEMFNVKMKNQDQNQDLELHNPTSMTPGLSLALCDNPLVTW